MRCIDNLKSVSIDFEDVEYISNNYYKLWDNFKYCIITFFTSDLYYRQPMIIKYKKDRVWSGSLANSSITARYQSQDNSLHLLGTMDFKGVSVIYFI